MDIGDEMFGFRNSASKLVLKLMQNLFPGTTPDTLEDVLGGLVLQNEVSRACAAAGCADPTVWVVAEFGCRFTIEFLGRVGTRTNKWLYRRRHITFVWGF